MNIEICFESEEKLEFPYEAVIERVVRGALQYEDCPCEAEISVLLTDAEEIRRLNEEFRGIDRTTDVLSFPAVDFEEGGDFGILEEEFADMYFNPETEDLVLGDIAVSVPKIHEQARSYGHSEERELAFLIAHSMLHLMGYDHMEDAEREIMETKQREILDRLGITR